MKLLTWTPLAFAATAMAERARCESLGSVFLPALGDNSIGKTRT